MPNFHFVNVQSETLSLFSVEAKSTSAERPESALFSFSCIYELQHVISGVVKPSVDARYFGMGINGIVTCHPAWI